jgi:ubiquinone/menaquinone biosynthesis C-methylase UbiE
MTIPVFTDSKTEKVAQIIQRIYSSKIDKLLVVGCGEGIEEAILDQQLNARVVGIDIENNFDQTASQIAQLQTGNAMSLDFEDDSFDFVFSYHALEHIDEPKKALREIHRVLKKRGGYWIGTPNKSRIIGYVGGKNTSLAEKIKWNLADWRARVNGKFENEFGAHAGFTAEELRRLLSGVFSETVDQTKIYFREVYARYPRLIKLIERSRFSQSIYPSIYFSGAK